MAFRGVDDDDEDEDESGAGDELGAGDDDESDATQHPQPGPAGPGHLRLHRPAFDRGGNREQRDALAEERFDLLGRIALSLCLIGVVAAFTVRILVIVEPRTWSSHDAGNTLLGTELVAMFFGLLAHRRPLGKASAVIGAVLALGAWIAMA